MTTGNNSEAWIRDYAADANPDLVRKRLRKGEDPEGSPLSSSNGSVVIEAVEVAPLGTSFDNAIQLYDDPVMESYSESFSLSATNLSPARQLERLLRKIDAGNYIEPQTIVSLAVWLRDHLSATDGNATVWQAVYLQERDFFAHLGEVIFVMLSRTESIIDIRMAPNTMHRLREAVELLYTSLTGLSTRILLCLPPVVESTVVRRDSANLPAPLHKIRLFWHVQILAQMLSSRNIPASSCFKECLGFAPEATAKSCREIFLQEPLAKASLITLLKHLGRAHSEIADAWETIDAVLWLARRPELGLRKELEVVLDIAQTQLLPIVCEKHPRTLPDSFLETLVGTTSVAIKHVILDTDIEGASSVYLRYIRGDHDALLPESAGTSSIPTLLSNLVGGHQDLLAKLMTTAWALQALKKFIFSDIMDVRSQGVTLLSTRLGNVWNRHHAAHLESEHPVLQYVARFMRVNELTKYILGPNSHASLVSHSQDIVGFLAASGAFTELEADIIWHACTTSVEAEFVRASFGILSHLYQWLSMEHLRYLARKYITTPPSRIGRDAVESLYVLLTQMNLTAERAGDQQDRLAYPFTCIAILKHVTTSPELSCSESLSRIMRQALTEFAKVRPKAEDRIQVYNTCVSDIVGQTESATTSIEILLMFLRRLPTTQEAEWLRENLSTDALSSELAHFVENLPVTSESSGLHVLSAIGIRIEAVVRLLAFQPAAPSLPDTVFLRSFYRYIAGDKAIHNDAREAAWVCLSRLSSVDCLRDVVVELLHHFTAEEAMSLPPEHITPQLVDLWSAELMNDILTKAEGNTPPDFLSMPLWQKLVETAEGPTTVTSHQLAIEMICRILFNDPLHISTSGSSHSYDAEFTNRQIDRLCAHHQTYTQSKQDEDRGKILRGIDILEVILDQSRNPPRPDHDIPIGRIDLVDETTDKALSCILRVRDAKDHTKDVELHIARATTVQDLLVRLPAITGAAEHEITVAGKPINLNTEANISLSQLGVSHHGVIMVTPTRSSSTDAGKDLKTPGHVEQQILAHFTDLQGLLSGPELVGEKIYQLLAKITPPVAARARFTVPGVTAVDVFPPSHTWQSIYSIFVLSNHLVDLRTAGRVDEPFFIQSVRLLVTVLVDDKWPLLPSLHVRVMDCLAHFLEQCPEIFPSKSLVEDADRFTSRMINLSFYAARGEMDAPLSAKINLLDCAIRCLFLLSQKQESVLKAFTQHSRFVELNKSLLLSPERSVSANTASIIRKFCLELDTVGDTVDFYMNVLITMLPDALGHGYMSIDYFVITTEVILANRAILSDENRARALVQTMITQLWSYDHSESVDLPLVDPVIAGLLRVLAGAVNVLRSFKKPLNLQGLSTSLFRRLLFPRLHDADSKLLVDPQTRHVVYDLVPCICETFDDFVDLLDGATAPLYDASHDPSASYPGRAAWLRPAWKCAGLTNLGMTCYMNSLLQQLFSNTQFRKFIFDTAAIDPVKQSFLYEVQRLFGNMQDEYNTIIETMPLAQNLGTQIENQEDVHGFYEDFLSRLEMNMPDETSKLRLSKFFTGKLISQIKGECGHVSPKSEPFVDLPIIVKNKPSLQDSLDEFVQGEPMEGTNQYRCQACDPDGGGRLVNAMKRTCLEELPENVTFCLKRFTFEAMLGLDGKVNDRFEFPETIDLSRYLRSHLENPSAEVAPDHFELVGVIVHQGTLQIGHYWSYTLLRSCQRPDYRTWVKLEDGNVSSVDSIAEVQRECFGGQVFSNGSQRSDNAYVLFYQRKSSLDKQMSRTGHGPFEPGTPLPPRVAIPTVLKRSIHEANGWRQRIAHLFDDDFAATVEKLLSSLREYLSTSNSSSASDDSPSDDGSSRISMELDRLPNEGLMDRVSDLGMTYLLRVATCDTRASQKVNAILDQLCSILSDQPKIAYKLLDRFFQSQVPFQGVLTHGSEAVRAQICGFVLQCMACLRQQSWAAYEEILSRFEHILNTILGSPLDLSRINWPSFFGFTAKLAQAGIEETKAILDADALLWSFKMLHLQCDQIMAQKNVRMLELVQNNPSRVSALYNFIGDVLSSHVDLTDQNDDIGPHPLGNDGVMINDAEMDYLGVREYDGVLSWIWLAKYAETKRNWREFAPGKLVDLILNREGLEGFVPALGASLQRHNEREEQQLSALFHLTLRFCVGYGDTTESRPVFNALAKTFPEWDRALDILTFMQQAYVLIPETTLQSLNLWCEQFLMHKSRKVQQHTEQWLQEVIFQPRPILSNPTLDAYRVRQIRRLVPNAGTQLRAAYAEEKPRARYEVLINILKSAGTYLRTLRMAVQAQLESKDAELRAKVSQELRVEYDESRSCLSDIEIILEELAHWVSDDGMPPNSIDRVSRSVETVSEDAETSEDGTWEDGSEQI